MENIIADIDKIDPHERFEAIKRKFFEIDTHLDSQTVEEVEQQKIDDETPSILPTMAQLEKSI